MDMDMNKVTYANVDDGHNTRLELGDDRGVAGSHTEFTTNTRDQHHADNLLGVDRGVRGDKIERQLGAGGSRSFGSHTSAHHAAGGLDDRVHQKSTLHHLANVAILTGQKINLVTVRTEHKKQQRRPKKQQKQDPKR